MGSVLSGRVDSRVELDKDELVRRGNLFAQTLGAMDPGGEPTGTDRLVDYCGGTVSKLEFDGILPLLILHVNGGLRRTCLGNSTSSSATYSANLAKSLRAGVVCYADPLDA